MSIHARQSQNYSPVTSLKEKDTNQALTRAWHFGIFEAEKLVMLFLFVLAAYWRIQTSLHEAESALSAQNVALHTLIASHLLSFIKHCSQNLLFNNSSNELHATVNIQKLVTRLASQKKNPRILWNPIFNSMFTSWRLRLHTSSSYCLNIYFNIIFLSAPMSVSSLIISGFSTKKTEFLIFFSSVVCSVHLLMSECLYKRGVWLAERRYPQNEN